MSNGQMSAWWRRPGTVTLAAATPALAAALALALAGCGAGYVPARLSAPAEAARAGGGGLRVRAARVFLSDDVPESGLGADAALVVELEVANGGAQPHTLSAASASCVMDLDRARPAEARALVPAGGGEGPFPGGGALSEDPGLGSVVVPPGQTRVAWVLFRGYHFVGSDVPRRITLAVPDAGGRRLELVLADPAHGAQRWEVEPARGGWALAVHNTSLFGGQLHGVGVATQFLRVQRLGPLLLDVGLSSRLLVQNYGALLSPTSSFAATGLTAHLAYPFLRWGSWQEPRALGAYVGGEALALIANQARRDPNDTTAPQTYGALTVEAGLQIDIGALRPRATPFPLSATAPGLPRWSLRVGYVQWWVGGGSSAGYTTSLQLAW